MINGLNRSLAFVRFINYLLKSISDGRENNNFIEQGQLRYYNNN